MKTIIKISVMLFIVFTTSSCFLDGVKGNGNVEVHKRNISDDFVAIKASRGLQVYITQANKVSLEVEADENLHDLITTEVSNGVLNITSTKNIRMAKAKKVHVSVENLDKIMISSGAGVYSENTLNEDELKIKASSGALAKLRLKIEDLSCDTSSGAIVNLEGAVKNYSVESSSGSIVKSYDLKAKNCTAKATSGSNIQVYVKGDFDAKATSGANIKYSGNPKVERISKSSGGSIRSN